MPTYNHHIPSYATVKRFFRFWQWVWHFVWRCLCFNSLHGVGRGKETLGRLGMPVQGGGDCLLELHGQPFAQVFFVVALAVGGQ